MSLVYVLPLGLLMAWARSQEKREEDGALPRSQEKREEDGALPLC